MASKARKPTFVSFQMVDGRAIAINIFNISEFTSIGDNTLIKLQHGKEYTVKATHNQVWDQIHQQD